jgi:diguanylate cyclase (GGDEF)-like protein
MNTDKHVERTDVLTGSGNLLAFLETFSARLASNHETAFSVLLIDLNNFMSFNHQRGHAQGDSLLHAETFI